MNTDSELQTAERASDRSERSSAALDLDLVQRARRGEEAGVEDLLRRLLCVRAMLVRRNAKLGTPIDTAELEDVIQDTLIAIWNKLDRFEGYGSLEAWTFRFCVLELRSRVKSLGRRPVALDDVHACDAPEQGPGEDELEKVYAGLDRLGPPEESVIRMKLLDGRTFEQIATHLSASPNTVRAWYYRGLRKLRGLIGTRSVKLMGTNG